MAKRAAAEKPNKSEEIRKLIKTGAKPAEIQATLAQRGIKVSISMIYNVKSKMRARRSAKKIGKRRAAANNSAPPTDIKTLAQFIKAVLSLVGFFGCGAVWHRERASNAERHLRHSSVILDAFWARSRFGVAPIRGSSYFFFAQMAPGDAAHSPRIRFIRNASITFLQFSREATLMPKKRRTRA